MTRLPEHRARGHAELRDRLHSEIKRRYPDHQGPGGWDPSETGSAATRAPFGDDLGRGFIDAFALALHVLWTYQEAWADEGFLPLAHLDRSVDRLLQTIGYQPGPGTAAVGLQHIRCVEGATGLVPAGFKITSSARGEEDAVTYETLGPLRLDPALNEMRAWAPGAGDGDGGSGDGGGAGSGSTSDVPRLEPVSDALGDRLAAGAAGALAARRAARARVEMRRLADVLRKLREAGGEACPSVLESLCEQLCAAQQEAAAAPLAPGRMSESQALARRQLAKLAASDALAALEKALARCPGESDAEYRARLDAMASFLDTFVAGLVQDARDQVVLLRGTRAMARLDRAMRGGASRSALGTAAPGTDNLYLVALRGGRIAAGTFPMLRTGDWLVFAEDVERVDGDGDVERERVYREAVRVATARDEEVDGVRGRFTRITFEPPLARAYRLDDVVVLGNIAVVSEGTTVEETAAVSIDGRTLELSQRPLTWLAAPRAAGGRRPECRVWVGDAEWTRVDHLLDAGATDQVFAVEPTSAGGARLRFGDGAKGALVPEAATLRVRYRIGLGADANRAARRIDTLEDAHPAAESTFNPLAVFGGTPPEDREAARVRAPAALRAMDRAVSLADVRALALSYGGVHRAEVHRGARRGEIRVAVSGAAGGDVDDIAGLEAFLAARVAPGVRVVARNARAVPTFVEILLRVEPGADVIAVMKAVRARLGDGDGEPPGLLHPERTRIDSDLRLSEVYAAVDGVDGLSSCVVRTLYRQSFDAAGQPIAVTEAQRVLTDVVLAASDERLVWAPASHGRDGIDLEIEEERDR